MRVKLNKKKKQKRQKNVADIWVFDSILVLLKSVLIFHHRGFYGTDHEKSDGHNLIFQVQLFVMCKEKDETGGDNTTD